VNVFKANGRRIFFFGALGGLLFGYDTGVISGAILFIKTDFGLSAFWQGAVVAVLLLGAMAGAALAGPLSERLGRKPLIVIAGITFTVGAIVAALAPTTAVLIIARFVIGLAVGSAALVVPLYLSEIAPTEIRGAVASLNQMMIVTGILVAFIVNAIFASSGDWRWMLGLAAVPSLVLLIGCAFVPETPRFLVRRGKEKKAQEVFDEVRSDEVGADEHPRDRIAEIKETDEKQDEGGLSALRAPWVRPALVVAIGLAALQQFIGINTIIYYAPTTLTSAGFGSDAAIYANLIIGVLNVVATIVAVRLVDNWGRKPLLISGLVGMASFMAILGITSAVLSQPKSTSDPAAIITLICLAGFIVSFAATWGPVVWVMLPEVLPLHIRGTAMGVAVFANWAANFIVSQSFPVLLKGVGPAPVFIGFAVIGVLSLLFVKTLVPETKGRSLEEIEESLLEKAGRGDRRPAAAGAGSGRVSTP
jgi:sugar porter (SP) family MFS transporter